MRPSALWASLIGIVAVAAGLLAINLGFGNTPVLGLDLQGGVSVILAPTESASGEDLTNVRDLIRDELERRGIAEPDVRVEGENIVVDLPGVRDQQDAIDAVDVAGIVTLRPVIQCAAAPESTTPTTEPGATTPTTEPGATTPSTGPGATTPTTEPGATTPSTEPAPTAPAGFRRGTPEPTVPATTPPEPTTPATSAPVAPAPEASVAPTTAPLLPATPDPTDPAAPTQQDVLPVRDTGEVCVVGAAGGTGEVFSRGSADVDLDEQGRWIVVADLRDEATWNLVASQCFAGSTSCPSRQLAIVLDDVIQTAPVVNAATFPGSVSISGDFSEGEARDLARVLNRGAFPVNVEAQTVQTVSATLGEDSLRAAIISGIVGVVVVLGMLAAYYRKLVVVVAAGFVVWGMIVYSAASFVSQTTNYALSLAGATGIIVAIGVTADSYIVLFERLKDDVRAGRSPRNAAPRSFTATWRTIVAADLVSILAAVVLFWLSVGSVKGFALFLGLTAICDLIVCYFFTRPAVILLTRTAWLSRREDIAIGAPA